MDYGPHLHNVHCTTMEVVAFNLGHILCGIIWPVNFEFERLSKGYGFTQTKSVPHFISSPLETKLS